MSARRLAGMAGASATLALGVLLAGTMQSAAAARQLTIDPPGHGTFSEPFTANYVLGHPCAPGDSIAFQWEVGGPLLAQVPAGDVSACAISGVTLAPPQPLAHPELLVPGPHTVVASVIEGGRVLRGSEATAAYVLDPAEGGPGGLGGPTVVAPAQQTPDATPTPPPTPPPTPEPTATPPQPISATFPPHNCENGVPDGATPCPSSAGGVVALNTTPAAGTITNSDSSGPPPGFVLAVAIALLVGVLAASAAWFLSGRRGTGKS